MTAAVLRQPPLTTRVVRDPLGDPLTKRSLWVWEIVSGDWAVAVSSQGYTRKYGALRALRQFTAQLQAQGTLEARR